MSIGTLDDIIKKVRLLTSSGTSNQLTDSQIIDYINSFYLYDFPAEFRSLKLKDRYTFNTIRGIDVYPFDSEHYTTIEMPVYVAKRECKLFTDPWSFWGVNFNWQFSENLTQGDGSRGITTGVITGATQANPCVITSVNHDVATGNQVTISGVVGMIELNDNTYTATYLTANTFSINVDSTLFTPYVSGGSWSKPGYSATCQSTPLIRSVWNNPAVKSPTTPTGSYYPTPSQPDFSNSMIPSRVQNILITANNSYGVTQNITDDGAGNLIGDGTGTINYETGAVSVTFNTGVTAGNDINIQYNPATLAIPISILFFQNQFTMRPVPDKGYTVELVAYRQPSQALLGSADVNNPNFNGTAELNEWWECLAFGAAKKVYEDRLDPDGVALMDKGLRERYDVAEVRTYAQIGKARIPTLFSDQLQQSYGSGAFGFGNTVSGA